VIADDFPYSCLPPELISFEMKKGIIWNYIIVLL
jgi:hypothetical protein